MIVDDVTGPPESCVVYTPKDLAEAILDALGEADASATWLEPSCGNGVFVEAMMRKGINSSGITAIDLNKRVRLRDLSTDAKLGVDFLDWSKACGTKFDRIVGNPPYVRIYELPPRLKTSASSVLQPNNRPVGLRANCWYSFVCASLYLLKAGGSLAFVLPAAWDYAHYAAPVREVIGRWFKSVHVYRSLEPLFRGVDDGAVVLIAEGHGEEGDGQVRRSVFDTREELISALTRHRVQTERKLEGVDSGTGQGRRVRFKEVASLRIGAVTGDARYFLLTEDRRRTLGLPVRSCRPVISKDRHLFAAVIDEDVWCKLRYAGEKVWLFDPPESQLEHSAVKEYISLPESEGGCQRNAFKVSNREPWYRTKLPLAPDAFMSGHALDGPWLALRSMERLTATNTLYTVRFVRRLSSDEIAAWGIALLSTEVYDQWRARLRTYPAGLKKIEPGDLGNLVIPIIEPKRGMLDIYARAIKLMKSGESAASRALADEFVK